MQWLAQIRYDLPKNSIVRYADILKGGPKVYNTSERQRIDYISDTERKLYIWTEPKTITKIMTAKNK